MMKKFILNIVLFTSVFILVNAIYLIAIQSTDWDFKKRREAQKLDDPKFEVLVLGNSLAMDGIDCEFMTHQGMSSYNLALGGASLKTNQIQLEEYLNNYAFKPSVVILAVGSYMNNFEVDEIHPIVEFTRDNHKYELIDLPIYRFKWLFTELLKKLVSKQHRQASLKNGQLKFEKRVADQTRVDSAKQFDIQKFDTSQQIKNIINLCSKHSIKVVVVEMPGFKNTRHSAKASEIWLSTMPTNGLLLDYNYTNFGKIFSDTDDWIGNSHLNATGARKFTKVLLDDLRGFL